MFTDYNVYMEQLHAITAQLRVIIELRKTVSEPEYSETRLQERTQALLDRWDLIYDIAYR